MTQGGACYTYGVDQFDFCDCTCPEPDESSQSSQTSGSSTSLLFSSQGITSESSNSSTFSSIGNDSSQSSGLSSQGITSESSQGITSLSSEGLTDDDCGYCEYTWMCFMDPDPSYGGQWSLTGGYCSGDCGCEPQWVIDAMDDGATCGATMQVDCTL